MTFEDIMAKSYWHDSHRILFNKDCRSMTELPDESVQMVVTSPPYWGLRKYAGLPDLIWGGEKNCKHIWDEGKVLSTGRHDADIHKRRDSDGTRRIEVREDLSLTGPGVQSATTGSFCSLCGAWRGAYGLEPDPESYVRHTIEILREIKRVLRPDGVCFLNCGDSYFGGGNNRGNKSPISDKQASNFGAVGQLSEHQKNIGKHPILKAKDLCLIPFRVAISAQEDGWYIRSVIIWSKPNPMPESVTDRPTESHEYILMLTKSSRYYWDMEAVREKSVYPDDNRRGRVRNGQKTTDSGINALTPSDAIYPTRNLRSVWTFPTQPYPEAHFATYPEELVKRCVLAATPEVGCCSKCGKPWERIVDKNVSFVPRTGEKYEGGSAFMSKLSTTRSTVETKTLGWKAQCKCEADKVPSIVLDCFVGSGTSLKVAAELGRYAIGYELSEEYCKLSIKRNSQSVMS